MTDRESFVCRCIACVVCGLFMLCMYACPWMYVCEHFVCVYLIRVLFLCVLFCMCVGREGDDSKY